MVKLFSGVLAPVFLLIIELGSAAAADSTGVYWIFLRDKGPDVESRLVEFQKQLPSKTIQRRRKSMGCEIVTDIYDLPVYEPYIASLAKRIVKLREKSRWLNAISAEISLEDLASIEKQPFVTEIRPVLRSDPQSMKVQVTDSWTAGERVYQYRPTSIDYGRSFDQLEQIDVIWAHEQGYHGEGIIICFLDTGFLTYHHAFNHMDILATYDFINDDDFVGFDPDQDLPGQPDHGTGCLGTIGGYYPGELVGPAFEASYILCKTEETGSETAVEEDYYVAGLEWGERMGADVASSSLSYSDWYSADDYDGLSCVTTVAANIAFQKGMILCSSMGNAGPGKFTLGAPADSRYSLGIGAVQWNGELARFSSWGPTADGRIKPDVCARGVATVAATPYTTDGFGLWNGTSLSCPLAAGVVALVIQAHPGWSSLQVKEAVLETASRSTRPDIRYGWGIVNAMDAINYPSLSGYVIDRYKNSGMAGEIRLEREESGESITAQSESSGWFLFANLADGSYLITVDEKGYLPYRRSIEIPPSQDFDIVLQEIARE
jgi:serine protease AprX